MGWVYSEIVTCLLAKEGGKLEEDEELGIGLTPKASGVSNKQFRNSKGGVKLR